VLENSFGSGILSKTQQQLSGQWLLLVLSSWVLVLPMCCGASCLVSCNRGWFFG